MSRRASFQWGSASVSRELGIALEPVTRSEDPSERASCEQVDAAETSERREPHLCQRTDLVLQVPCLSHRELQRLSQRPDCNSGLLIQETCLARALRVQVSRAATLTREGS